METKGLQLDQWNFVNNTFENRNYNDDNVLDDDKLCTRNNLTIQRTQNCYGGMLNDIDEKMQEPDIKDNQHSPPFAPSLSNNTRNPPSIFQSLHPSQKTQNISPPDTSFSDNYEMSSFSNPNPLVYISMIFHCKFLLKYCFEFTESAFSSKDADHSGMEMDW